MTIKLNNPEIEHYFVSEFKSDIQAFSNFNSFPLSKWECIGDLKLKDMLQ